MNTHRPKNRPPKKSSSRGAGRPKDGERKGKFSPFNSPQRRRFYKDVEFTCRDCGALSVWPAWEQKVWFEEWQMPPQSTAVRCLACRQQKRASRPMSRQKREAFERLTTPKGRGSAAARRAALEPEVPRLRRGAPRPRPNKAKAPAPEAIPVRRPVRGNAPAMRSDAPVRRAFREEAEVGGESPGGRPFRGGSRSGGVARPERSGPPAGRGERPQRSGPPAGRGGRPERSGPPAGRGGRPQRSGPARSGPSRRPVGTPRRPR